MLTPLRSPKPIIKVTTDATLHREPAFSPIHSLGWEPPRLSPNMPSRHSTVPNLDLSLFKPDSNNGKLSSPRSPGALSSDGPSPLTPRSPKSTSSSPLFKGATIRPVTQDSNSKVNSPTIPASPDASAPDPGVEPSTPGLTAIPQYFPSPKDSPRENKHSRDASKSFFGTLKAPRPSHRAHRSDSSETSIDNPKSRGSSRDRKTQMATKAYESTPDLPGIIARAGENENSGFNLIPRLSKVAFI